MARRLENGTVLADNEFDFREVCRALKVNDQISTELARATIENVIRKMKAEGTEGTEGRLDKYYNTYRQGMDASLNAFLTHTKLQPIAHLFRLKSSVRISTSEKHWVNEYCTFTMLKKHFDYYQKNGVAPNVALNGRIGKHGGAKRTYVKFPGGGGTNLPQNETWERFKRGISVFNAATGSKYTLPEMLLMIMELFMAEKPEIFGQKNAVIDESKVVKTGGRFLHISIDEELCASLNAFIQRYNAVNTPKTSQNECVCKAIEQFLARMPLIYTEPKLYAEELALREKERVSNANT